MPCTGLPNCPGCRDPLAPPPPSEPVYLGTDIGEGVVMRATERAIQVRLDEHETPLWVPTSVLCGDNEISKEGERGVLVVRPWFARKVRADGFGF